MNYLPKDERRAELLDAAVDLLAAEGLAAVTSRAVAAAAGVSAGLVHHRFASTAELVAEAWRAYVDRERAAAELAALPRSRDAAARFFDNFDAEDDRGLALWADAWRHAQQEANFREAFTATFDELTRTLETALHEAADPHGAAIRLLLLAFGIAGARQISPGLVAEPAALMAAAIDRELAG